MAHEEVDALLQYFQKQLVENPPFFHAYQMNSKEQITIVFWTDTHILIDYGYFGDIVIPVVLL